MHVRHNGDLVPGPRGLVCATQQDILRSDQTSKLAPPPPPMSIPPPRDDGWGFPRTRGGSVTK